MATETNSSLVLDLTKMTLRGVAGSSASGLLLCVTAQDLQAEGDFVDPAPRMNAQVTAEQRRVKDGEGFIVRIAVSCEDLRGKKKKQE